MDKHNICSDCIFYSYLNPFLGYCCIIDDDVCDDFSCERFCDDITTILYE